MIPDPTFPESKGLEPWKFETREITREDIMDWFECEKNLNSLPRKDNLHLMTRLSEALLNSVQEALDKYYEEERSKE